MGATNTSKPLPPPPLNSIPFFAQLYLKASSGEADNDKYRRALGRLEELRHLIQGNVTTPGRLQRGHMAHPTKSLNEETVEEALWLIAYICTRFGGKALLRRDKHFYSQSDSRSRAAAMADILQKIPKASERARILSDVRDTWIKLRFLFLKVIDNTPLRSMSEIEWYFDYVLTVGPVETLRHIKSLRRGGKLGFETYSDLLHSIQNQRAYYGENVCESFRYFISSDLLCLTSRHLPTVYHHTSVL